MRACADAMKSNELTMVSIRDSVAAFIPEVRAFMGRTDTRLDQVESGRDVAMANQAELTEDDGEPGEGRYTRPPRSGYQKVKSHPLRAEFRVSSIS